MTSVAGNLERRYRGRFEWGPRALGARSIIADPRRAEMKDIVNAKIKFREAFRPFAPSVLGERCEEYFELPNAMSHYPARFMLYVVPVKEDTREVIPAITHVDNSGCLQTVTKETNPGYHRLIGLFGEATGVPVVHNTATSSASARPSGRKIVEDRASCCGTRATPSSRW